MALTEEQIVALVQVQLADLAESVERHGTDLGMLLDSLMSLIARHAEEGRAPRADDEVWSELARDHETMLEFAGPFLLARQFQDRLRQRLEHARRALAALPAAAAIHGGQREDVERLFPFEEERAASAAAFCLPYAPTNEQDIEVF